MEEVLNCIGIDLKEGEYQGRPFKNYVYYCISDRTANVKGKKTKELKIKFAYAVDIVVGASPDDLEGKRFTVDYNEYQQVKRINVIK